jgi:hypothetical protein
MLSAMTFALLRLLAAQEVAGWRKWVGWGEAAKDWGKIPPALSPYPKSRCINGAGAILRLKIW